MEIILSRWNEILAIIEEEVPAVKELEALYKKIGLPMTPAEVGVENDLATETFRFTGDIRDKYVLSRLLWDLGLDEIPLTITEDMR